MQLDTEEGETFVPPAGVVAADATDNNASNEERADDSTLEGTEASTEPDPEDRA